MASGELRGQIVTNNYTLITFGLDGTQQVPSNSSTASGDGYALVDRATLNTELTIFTREVDDAVAAHIHSGVRGENGSVLVALLQDTDESNVWFTPFDFTLSNDTLAAFLSAGHYVNVHTPAFVNGEIRGQIE